jgi:GTPase SAR1 family protein
MTTTIVLVGKVGHGKTYLINKICDTNYESGMTARSCTRSIQYGKTRQYGINVLDTPGFCSSLDMAAHISRIKFALEETKLFGVYVVVKYGRDDEMCNTINMVMDFVGTDDVRIIITHVDSLENELEDDVRESKDLKSRLHDLLDVPVNDIILVGKSTSSEIILQFIYLTLHSPIHLQVTEEQFAYASTFCVGARKYQRYIDVICSKLRAALDACKFISKWKRSNSTYVALYYVYTATQEMMTHDWAYIEKTASEEITLEEQFILQGKYEIAVTPMNREFHDLVSKNIPRFSSSRLETINIPLIVSFLQAGSAWTLKFSVNGTIDIPLECLLDNLMELDKLNQEKNNCRIQIVEIQTQGTIKRKGTPMNESKNSNKRTSDHLRNEDTATKCQRKEEETKEHMNSMCETVCRNLPNFAWKLICPITRQVRNEVNTDE